MDVVAIMPCRGRLEQTVRNVRRLLATAGLAHGSDWTLHLAGGYQESGLLPTIASQIAGETGRSIVVQCSQEPHRTYWQALAVATRDTDAPLIVNLANDLVPGRHWLARGLAAYRARFGAGDGLMGFNDGLHGPEHSPHFVISRGLLGRYGGWPVWYQHNFGDTELCARAQQDGCYGKAPWAVLYHDHLETGADDDAVYAAGRATYAQDAARYERRRQRGWTD